MSDMGEFIPHGQRDLKFLREGHRRGQRFEREAIVAWLRSRIAVFDNPVLTSAADLIESGEHLRGEDE